MKDADKVKLFSASGAARLVFRDASGRNNTLGRLSPACHLLNTSASSALYVTLLNCVKPKRKWPHSATFCPPCCQEEHAGRPFAVSFQQRKNKTYRHNKICPWWLKKVKKEKILNSHNPTKWCAADSHRREQQRGVAPHHEPGAAADKQHSAFWHTGWILFGRNKAKTRHTGRPSSVFIIIILDPIAGKYHCCRKVEVKIISADLKGSKTAERELEKTSDWKKEVVKF